MQHRNSDNLTGQAATQDIAASWGHHAKWSRGLIQAVSERACYDRNVRLRLQRSGQLQTDRLCSAFALKRYVTSKAKVDV